MKLARSYKWLKDGAKNFVNSAVCHSLARNLIHLGCFSRHVNLPDFCKKSGTILYTNGAYTLVHIKAVLSPFE
jgi:hypothetical protein